MSEHQQAADAPGGRTPLRRLPIQRSSAADPGSAPGAGRRSAPPLGRSSGHGAGGQDRGRPDELTGRITVQDETGGQVLHVTGDMDAAVLQQFTHQNALDRLRILAVDVGELGYIDSTGLSFLVRWAETARADGRPAQIRRATHRFGRVLELSGLTPLFELTPRASPPDRAPQPGG